MTQSSHYDNPLIGRYASEAMSQLWGPQRKFGVWRRLWVILAEAEHELGLPIARTQIDELKSKVDDIDFALAQQYEKRLRHDVMAHVHTYGDACPGAKAVIHLGATSCYVTDNGDLILMREGMQLLRQRLAQVIVALADFAKAQKDLPCLAYTHLQPAQPTTVGKRACLWNYDLVLDLAELDSRISGMKARSIKGTTGTQASFLELFGGDHAKVRQLEKRVAEKMGFSAVHAVGGQTYTRKVDAQILDALSGIAQSAHKMCTDLRLLAGQKEIEEPFEKDQIGSSAMAYKRNPMRSERVCSLARYVMGLPPMLAQTVATQWMERTLDDSAIRRLAIPQAFLAVDAILILLQNIADGLVVYPHVIAHRLNEELPFMATENILMAAVAAGGDRQDLHERIRQHSVAAAKQIKEEGRPNDLMTRLKSDSPFSKVNLDQALAANQFTGRAAQQVEEFEAEIITPIRQSLASAKLSAEDLRV
jgi:adenylosuccinate lyase